MKALRIGAHGLVLTLADFAGIPAGFAAFRTFDFEQIRLRLPMAVAVAILLFGVGSLLLRVLGGRQFLLLDLRELFCALFAALALNLMVIVPLYYFTRDHYNPLGQVVFPVLYQLPVNLIALCGVWIIQN